jgi:hypothetical protein
MISFHVITIFKTFFLKILLIYNTKLIFHRSQLLPEFFYAFRALPPTAAAPDFATENIFYIELSF